MLINLPVANDLNEIALRLHFDAWQRLLRIIANFQSVFSWNGLPWEPSSEYLDEWNDYIMQAQSELGAIAASVQQSSELKLKSIICDTNALILLLRSDFKLKSKKSQVDFSEQRTLDASELPAAILTLTDFDLSDQFVKSYQEFRRLRNKVLHSGKHYSHLLPQKILQILCLHYAALWPDGKWLQRRVNYDGNSAAAFFEDGRYLSAYSNVMAELPLALTLFHPGLFKKCIGVTRKSLTIHCPVCKDRMASKDPQGTFATGIKLSSKNAKCLMCETALELDEAVEVCNCGSKLIASGADAEPCCAGCGAMP